MKQRGIGEYAIEVPVRQIEPEEILLPYVASCLRSRHFGEACGAIQPDRNVAECGKCLEVAPRSAAEIENREGWLVFGMAQQRGDVLLHIMTAGGVEKIRGARVVVLKGQGFPRRPAQS